MDLFKLVPKNCFAPRQFFFCTILLEKRPFDCVKLAIKQVHATLPPATS